MESDSKNDRNELTQEQKEVEPEQEEVSNNFLSFRDFFQSIRIRCNSIDINQVDRFLIWCQLGIVFPCGLLFWFIFFIIR